MIIKLNPHVFCWKMFEKQKKKTCKTSKCDAEIWKRKLIT